MAFAVVVAMGESLVDYCVVDSMLIAVALHAKRASLWIQDWPCRETTRFRITHVSCKCRSAPLAQSSYETDNRLNIAHQPLQTSQVVHQHWAANFSNFQSSKVNQQVDLSVT